MLRSIQMTSWLNSAGGGIPPVIRALTKEFRKAQSYCVIAGLDHPAGNLPAFPENWPVLTGRVVGPLAFGYSPELARRLRHWMHKDVVIHEHGLWMYPGWLGRKLAEATGAGRVVSPHGMLDPWALKNSRWKKRLAAWAFENRNLRTAACLHALCAAEAQAMRDFGLKNPICVIPNGVDPPEIGISKLESENPPWTGSIAPEQKVLLYLGRIHPKKGLCNLLKAWSVIRRGNSDKCEADKWVLVIAGWDQDGHTAELRMLASTLALGASVHFPGPWFGADKAAAYRHTEAFVLPSLSEGLPLVVLEAWSHGRPVVMTAACHLPEGFSAGAALETTPDPHGLAVALTILMEATDAERKNMGERGRALVERQFTWAGVACQMAQVYRWVLGEETRPSCVIV